MDLLGKDGVIYFGTMRLIRVAHYGYEIHSRETIMINELVKIECLDIFQLFTTDQCGFKTKIRWYKSIIRTRFVLTRTRFFFSNEKPEPDAGLTVCEHS